MNHLFVEYLIVIDSTVYSLFNSAYGHLEEKLLGDYINIYFNQIVNVVT